MYIPVPVNIEDLLHEASIFHAEEFLEMVLNKFFSRADVEDAIRAHFKQRLQKDEPLPDFIYPSKLSDYEQATTKETAQAAIHQANP